ncbi:RNA-directed DNA polymerase from mobile element jockey [Eumeta japonica]|uniref:RNA-directed DNA polymerase from mobile element jockey n=1 Tax=Eumeta variegata TaxID=151549 RepID=A0A4C1W451_EUMVA|nr:RNA-directed DNA polymerase from mobile element jockey [Eumeta japonica]
MPPAHMCCIHDSRESVAIHFAYFRRQNTIKTRKKLPRDVKELIKAKNAALRQASKYPTCENRSHAHTLQRKVRDRIQDVRNDNWSDLIVEIKPCHKAFWGLTKALKTEKALLPPTLRKIHNSIVFDGLEKAECLADSIEQQCSENLSFDVEHVRRVEEEVRRRVTLPPKGDLDPITQDEISKHIKALKIRKGPGENIISSKVLKCFSAPLVALLVTIFNACIKNCYFPIALKEAVVIGIPKPGKPRNLPASYRPISLLSILGKLFEKTLKTRLSEHLIVRPIRAGLPQGSTLFSLLYSGYVNNISRPKTDVQLALFADDTALFLRSNCFRNTLPRSQRAIDEQK